jgi:hypothetical protein
MPASYLSHPIATRVLRAARLSWNAWAMEPGGLWVCVGCSCLTRHGAKRELRLFLRGLA